MRLFDVRIVYINAEGTPFLDAGPICFFETGIPRDPNENENSCHEPLKIRLRIAEAMECIRTRNVSVYCPPHYFG